MCGLLLAGFAACSDDDPEPTPPPPPGTQLAKPVLSSKNVDANSFVVAWDAVNGATSYAYTVNDEAQQTTSSTQISRTGLTPETAYTVKVKAVAEGYTDSEWATITVTTLAGDTPEPSNDAFTFDIPADQITAFSAFVKITPKDKDAYYYAGVMPKAEFEQYGSVQAIADELIEYLGEVYPGMLYLFLQTDEAEMDAETGPETDYVAYAFNWDLDGNITDNMVTAEFTTPAGVKSSSKITVEPENVTDTTMDIRFTPDAAFESYYIIFAETSAVDQYAAQNGENALVILPRSEGEEASGSGIIPLTGLAPKTSYTVLVFALDAQGGYFYERKDVQTLAEVVPDKVESELFTTLLGSWNGTQRIMDYDDETQKEFENTINFTVNIVSSVKDYDRDYRKFNQLVGQIDKYGGIPYYGIAALLEHQFPKAQAEAKFGPKILLTISKGDVISIDGQMRKLVYGWSQAGDTYFVSGNLTSQKMDTQTDLVVELSEDKNTLTIKSPESLGAGYYPSLVTPQGQPLVAGLSNIVLTRNGNAPAQAKRTAISKAERAQVNTALLQPIRPASIEGRMQRTSFSDKMFEKWTRKQAVSLK